MKMMKMMILFMAAAFTATASTGCMDWEGIKGNGKVEKQEREIGSFEKIKVSGAFEVILVQGNDEKIIVEADENLLEIIVTEVSGSTLKIFSEENIRESEELNIYLTFKTLESIETSGAVEIKGKEKMDFEDLAIEASGASEIDLQLKAKTLKLDLSGASEVDLEGYCMEMIIDASGASEIETMDLECEIVKMDVSGASSVRVKAMKEISIDASGASSVRYGGNPEKVFTNVSGVGSAKPY